MITRTLSLTLLLVGLSLGRVSAQPTPDEGVRVLIARPTSNIDQFHAVTGLRNNAANRFEVSQIDAVGEPIIGVYQQIDINYPHGSDITIHTAGLATLEVSNTTSTGAGGAIWNSGHLVAGGAISVGDAIAINSAGIGLAINDGDEPPLGVYGVVNCIGHALEASNASTDTIQVWVSPFTIHYGSGS